MIPRNSRDQSRGAIAGSAAFIPFVPLSLKKEILGA
jgi:hypothetical protein